MGAMYYRKRDVVVEAIQFTGDNGAEVCGFAPYESFSPESRQYNNQILIWTSHGRVWVSRGDWVLRQQIHGVWDCWPVGNAAFQEMYVPARTVEELHDQPDRPIPA